MAFRLLGRDGERTICRCDRCGLVGKPSIHPCHKWHHTCRWIDPKLAPIVTTWPCPFVGLGDVAEGLIGMLSLHTIASCGACKGRGKWLNTHFPLTRWYLRPLKRLLCPEPKQNLARPRLLFTLPGHGELAEEMRRVFAAVKQAHPNWTIDVVCCPKIGRALKDLTGRQYRKAGKGKRPNRRRYQMVRKLPWCECDDPAEKCLADFFGLPAGETD